MKSSQDHPPPDTDRVPLTRLTLLFILLVGTPIVLVLMLTRPDGEVPVSPSAPATTPSAAATAPSPTEDTTATSPAAIARSRRSPRPRPALQRPRQLPPHPPAPPSATPADRPTTPQPAPDLTCGVTVLSWGTSVYSPWAALGHSDSDLSLPAPLDARYLVLALGIHPAADAASRLLLVDEPDEPADLRLVVHGTDGDSSVSPLGSLTQPADRVTPFDTAVLRFAPGAAGRDVTLAFVVPVRATSAALVVDGTLLQDIPLPKAPPPDTTGLAGTWHKLPAQRLHLRYADPILDALCNSQHRVLAVRRSPLGAWLFEFPFTDVTAPPARHRPDRPIISLNLAHGPDRRDAQVRLTDGGNVLILYLGRNPAERLAYRRTEP